jgi:hypothetical protein
LAIPLWLTVLAWTIAGLIVILNAKLLFDALAGSLK